MANYHLDTEFSESGPIRPITLISLALVADDGRELYLVNGDALPPVQHNPWVMDHVIPNLDLVLAVIGGPVTHLASLIESFVAGDPHPVFWGYYSAYDWVVFCQLWNVMDSLPDGWPAYCRDLRQFVDALGADPARLAGAPPTRHNALEDARWIARLRRALATPDSPHTRLSHFFRGEM